MDGGEHRRLEGGRHQRPGHTCRHIAQDIRPIDLHSLDL
jgi:hypothetical protein